jgi:hypothetical protein
MVNPPAGLGFGVSEGNSVKDKGEITEEGRKDAGRKVIGRDEKNMDRLSFIDYTCE